MTTETGVEVTRKRVDDVLVATIRFRGEVQDVPQALGRLYEQVEPHIVGKGMLLHHYYDQSVGEGNDLEVCYPVSRPVGTEEVRSRVLPGGEMLCAIHVGPPFASREEGGMGETWPAIWGYMRRHSIFPAAEPARNVLLEGAAEHGDNESKYVTELQLPYGFHRMERLDENLARHAGEQVRREVMAGVEAYETASPRERAAWFQRAIERLDALVEDEATRCDVMISCAHRFPLWRIEALRAEYERSGDIDALLETMRADRTLGDLSWYEAPVRKGNVIWVTKDPFDPEKHRQATDTNEKRAAYCHCGVLKETLLEGVTMSRTYCYCGAGWYQQTWEGILQRPVRIEVVRSVLQGDDDCTFAIHLPLEEEAT